MTIRAIFGRRFVEQHLLPQDLLLQGVALGALHIRVPTRQRKLRLLVVVKRGRSPMLVHMAIRALRDRVPVLGLDGELAAVGIRVAGFALLRCTLELNLVGAGEHLVAFAARNPAVSPDQWEFRFRMVEAADVDPGLGAVARFAAERSAIGAFLRHAVFEFALVDILVAGGARAVREMERENFVRSSAQAHFVALRAGHGHVGSGQHKVGVLVLGNGERRAMKILYGMAVLATVLVGSGGKLLVMRILMAIRARREFYFVLGVLSGRCVAFIASDGYMFSFERILRGRMLFHAKLRWLPALNGVALRTLSLARPRLELPLMRVGGVAIHALGKGHLLLKITRGVAVATSNFHMRAQERIFCFRMVELHRRIHFFPTVRRMAGFARSLEGPLVRIRMAIDAGVEFDPGILHRLVRAGWEMALLACYLGMHSGQGIFGFRMVELLRLFPVGYVVAARAVGTELAFVDVLMAGHAFL